ncbi:hypothetical protein SEMRO_2784_G336970.1 [Seminavis robusta]|uniref:Uncharacterized protein n=1 Tax=Seminavis robusta TaxID=568900 RepID=A0A9N8F423_9STRA|nr:hypothetical protein SEMRO_2784_G336970.1 [Seminavis robusta]|eukprot:Sro2784_g336970.1 n/a (181) ;mRNA; r:2311-2933
MAAMEDTRKKVGGKCWAQAERVSKECKRIFGAALSDTWLEGIVIKVDQRLSNPSAKRATTYITALYKLGERDGIAIEKEKELTMQSLKAANPKAPTENNNNNDDSNRTLPSNPPPNDNNGEEEPRPPATSTAPYSHSSFIQPRLRLVHRPTNRCPNQWACSPPHVEDDLSVHRSGVYAWL